MGFIKRLTEFFLIFSADITDQDSLKNKLPSDVVTTNLGPVSPICDTFDPSSINGCCNSRTNRTCWKTGFDIHTDYEEVIPQGVVREVSSTCSHAVEFADK